ncbi:MAG TPA: hypothetical protein VND45_07775, partial [Thermoanaerobaculia bacterium]|nr:hypothetical protein [Thermoanaerobaculia bacterium]
GNHDGGLKPAETRRQAEARRSTPDYNRGVRIARPAPRFAVSAIAVVGTCIAVLRSHAFAANADVAAWGITFDLTISIPLLYWFVVVRTGHARPLTVAPLFLLGSAFAAWLLPASQQQFLRQLGSVVGPAAEVLLVGALVRRIVAARRNGSVASSDPYERIAAAARTIAGEGRVAEVIASEVTILCYALLGWRMKAEETRGRVLTFHERNGWGTIVVCIYAIIAAEGVGMHLLLRLWNPLAAWAWTGLDLWAAMWLLGDYHALRLRRTFIDDHALHLRYGLRWSGVIPRDAIESVEAVRDQSQWKRKDVLKVAMFDAPRWLVTLREPVVIHGMAGLRKSVRAIALLPDQELDPAALLSAGPRATSAGDTPSTLR